jgi:hypothetical protein
MAAGQNYSGAQKVNWVIFQLALTTMRMAIDNTTARALDPSHGHHIENTLNMVRER